MYKSHLPTDRYLLNFLRGALYLSMLFLLFGWSFDQTQALQVGLWVLVFIPITRVLGITLNLIFNKEKAMSAVGILVLLLLAISFLI